MKTKNSGFLKCGCCSQRDKAKSQVEIFQEETAMMRNEKSFPGIV